LVVGIGASAGGLEALLRFIPSVPADVGLAFVVVQHLDPSQPSALVSILAGHSQVPIVPITQGLRVTAGTVFVAPPNAYVRLDGDVFELSSPRRDEPVRHPIDAFFASLAASRGAACAAVVVSGTGTDGAAGVRSVKASGGWVLVQSDPTFSGMPDAALATGLVDRVVPAAELYDALDNLAADGPGARPAEAEATRGAEARIDPATLAAIQDILLARTGHDFSGYKASTLVRRIQHRLLALQVDGPDRYLARLSAEPDEAQLLMADLLIGVTHFFRDPEAFAALDQQVISPLVAARAGTGAEIRVWVPGCSTGEEVYALAILLQEALERVRVRPPPVTIFATDIDADAIETARRGRYMLGISDHLSRERLERFFVREGDGWRVTRSIRDLCIFSTHSVIRDPPFARLDLVSCRNLLIYLSADVQQRLLRLFNYVLAPQGHLFLGPSESVDRPELFAVVDKKFRIFRRLDSGRTPLPDRPVGLAPLVPVPAMLPARSPAHVGAVARAAERLILENYAPPCVVVDRNGQVVSTSGRTSRYLELPTGAPSLNVVDLVCGALRFDLRDAMDRCRQSGEVVTVADVPVTTDGLERRVDLIVRPLGERTEGTLLLVFREGAVAPRDRDTAPDARIARLEAELVTARHRVQAAIDELTVSREDFQQTNEELLSLNEELQAANEELQTSKEEMQSINEEVETVNAELRQKVEELDHANSDLQNLFRTQIATVFLDRELRIKRFTPACQRLFRLVDTDVGRPIGHILPLFAYQGLDADIREVLDSLAPLEREVPSADGAAWYGMRILPYRTTDDLIAGVVLTFVDLTTTRQLQRRSALLAAIVDSSFDAIYSTAPDGTLTSWNAAAARLFGWEPGEVIGRPEVLVFGAGERSGGPGTADAVAPFTTQLPSKDGRLVEVVVTSSPIRDPAGGEIGRSNIVHDVSQRRLLEAELEQARKMEGLGLLAGGIAHDFNNLLTAIVGHASLAERKLGPEHPARGHMVQIIATSQRSTALTRQLLAFAGREVVPARVLDANALLTEFTPILQGLIPASIAVVLHLADEPALVRIDPSRFEQVLMNLVVNARDAMPGGGTLTVTLSTVEGGRAGPTRAGAYVRVTVTDVGEGMTPEQRAHCFDPFYTTKSTGRGTGLGLASAYGIVHAAGGFIEVDSARGRGSSFAVHLPRVAVAPVVAVGTPESGPDPVGTETVLLVEDAPAVRETSAGSLRAQGYQVLTANDGVEALALLDRHEGVIHLVVTDVVMPRMGGRQLALAVRARHPAIKVLYVTGYAPEENAPAVEGSDLLLKPFSPSALVRAVRDLLDR
jgi:two-component system CheB/CheR fusion protein